MIWALILKQVAWPKSCCLDYWTGCVKLWAGWAEEMSARVINVISDQFRATLYLDRTV